MLVASVCAMLFGVVYGFLGLDVGDYGATFIGFGFAIAGALVIVGARRDARERSREWAERNGS